MKFIEKEIEPECLTSLREVEANTYDDLRGDCKQNVINQLRHEQNSLCAYCEKSIKNLTFIEHYHSQTSSPDLQLTYLNFLGVCSGIKYINKGNGLKKLHCDSSRGSTQLNISPLFIDHINTISFNEEDRIISSNSIFNNDLNNVLNLNFKELCLERRNNFDIFLNSLYEMKALLSLTNLEFWQKALNLAKNKNVEFISYFEFRLNQQISQILE